MRLVKVLCAICIRMSPLKVFVRLEEYPFNYQQSKQFGYKQKSLNRVHEKAGFERRRIFRRALFPIPEMSTSGGSVRRLRKTRLLFCTNGSTNTHFLTNERSTRLPLSIVTKPLLCHPPFTTISIYECS